MDADQESKALRFPAAALSAPGTLGRVRSTREVGVTGGGGAGAGGGGAGAGGAEGGSGVSGAACFVFVTVQVGTLVCVLASTILEQPAYVVVQPLVAGSVTV